MTLLDLMVKSGLTDVFAGEDGGISPAMAAYAKSTRILIDFRGEDLDIIGTERVGDDMTIVTD